MKRLLWKTKNQRGSALVMALMVMVILSSLATTFLIMSSSERQISENEAVITQNFYVAEAGVEETIRLLLYKDEDFYHPRAGKDNGPGNPSGFIDLYEYVLGVNGYTEGHKDTLYFDIDGQPVVSKLYGIPPSYATAEAEVAVTDCLNDQVGLNASAFAKPVVMDRCEIIEGVKSCFKTIFIATTEGYIRRYDYRVVDGCYKMLQIGDPWIVPTLLNPPEIREQDIYGDIVTKKVRMPDGSIQDYLPDIDRDGVPDLIFKDSGVRHDYSRVYVYNAYTGARKAWWSDTAERTWWDCEIGDVSSSYPGEEIIVPMGESGVYIITPSDLDGEDEMRTIKRIEPHSDRNFSDDRYPNSVLHPSDWCEGCNPGESTHKQRSRFVTKPIVGQVDGTGSADIVVNDGHFLLCYANGDWNEPKWVYRVGLQTDASAYGDGSFLLDANGDGRPDAGATFANGQLMPAERGSEDNYFWQNHPAAWDLDGDGDLEIITTFITGKTDAGINKESSLYRWCTHAVVLDDQNVRLDESGFADYNWNGVLNETGADAPYVVNDIRIPLWGIPARNVLGNDAGEAAEPPQGLLVAQRPPGIGDLDNDGTYEILVQTSGALMYCVNVAFNKAPATPGGAPIKEYSLDGLTATYFYYNPASDTTHWYNTGTYQFYDLDGNGVADFPVGVGGSGDIHGTPTLINVDSDPELEIIYGTVNRGGPEGSSIFVWDNTLDEFGNPNIWARMQFESLCESESDCGGSEGDGNRQSFNNGVTVSDLNGDGYQEIIAATDNHTGFQWDGRNSQEQQSFIFSLNNINLPKILITVEAMNADTTEVLRTVEALVQLRESRIASTGNSINVLQYIER